MVKQFLRRSTYKNYRYEEYERHFKHRLGNLRLRDFRTAHGQRLISAIAKDHPEIGHKTLLRLKSFLVWRVSSRPCRGLPRWRESQCGMCPYQRAYAVQNSKAQFTRCPRLRLCWQTVTRRITTEVLPSPLWRSLHSLVSDWAEIQGLQWGSFQGDRLSVERTVWRTTEGLPKTESSENTVPVIPILRSMLENYRQYLEGPVDEGNLGKDLKPTDWMFVGQRRNTSINLPNLVRRVIIPNLARFENSPKWKGWHAMRRSVSDQSLLRLNVRPAIIQADAQTFGYLNHDESSTWRHQKRESRDALDKLLGLVDNSPKPR